MCGAPLQPPPAIEPDLEEAMLEDLLDADREREFEEQFEGYGADSPDPYERGMERHARRAGEW